ncbi:MAG: PIN domain-containing protein [Candidatus Geothermarchaeales archaeon]
MIDSNFLLRAVEEGRDVLALIDDVLGMPVPKATLGNVLEELKKLCETEKKARKVQTALKLAEKLEILPYTPASSTDEAIVKTSAEGGFAVATNDLNLRRELRAQGIPVIYFKDGYLSVEGYITF